MCFPVQLLLLKNYKNVQEKLAGNTGILGVREDTLLSRQQEAKSKETKINSPAKNQYGINRISTGCTMHSKKSNLLFRKAS